MELTRLGVNDNAVWVNKEKITKIYLQEEEEHSEKVWYAIVVFEDIENYEKFFMSANDREVADINMDVFIKSINSSFFS